MMNLRGIPFYMEATIKLIMILCLCTIITLGQSILIPLVFSILLSILLLPVDNFLENKLKISRSVAILLAIISVLIIFSGLIYFLSYHIARFLKDIPSIKLHLNEHYTTLQNWINQKFNISNSDQLEILNNATADAKSSGKLVIGETFLTIAQVFLQLIIVAIFSFLMLYYRHTIKTFLITVFKKEHSVTVTEVLQESKGIVQKYMLGLVIEMGIVALANSTVLLIIGVKYAIFLGVFCAILNIIPYVGILTGIIFSCLITLTTSTDLGDIVWIIVCFEIVHFIDCNFLMPRIVGSKVKINALITIVGVVLGGMLLGLSGIFLALPVIAILKIIFDKVDGLKPWGILLGDNTTVWPNNKLLQNIKKDSLKEYSKDLAMANSDQPNEIP